MDCPWLPAVAETRPVTFGLRASQPIQVYDATPDFEGAGRGVILVFDPNRAAGTAGELRPGVLRGWWYYTMHQLSCALQLVHFQ